MKTLYLMRHSKAVQDADSGSDFDRTLTERGLNDALIMGQRLRNNHEAPALIIASSAIRTSMTAQEVAARLDYPEANIIFTKSLYNAGEETYLKTIHHVEDTLDSVMLIGHNPTISSLISALSGEGVRGVSTSGIARINFDIHHWKELRKGKLVFLWEKE